MFRNPRWARHATSEILRTSHEQGVAVPAYCVMPDHVHLLCEVPSADRSLLSYTHAFKRDTGFAYRQSTGAHLWQPSYFDRGLRYDDDRAEVIAYIVLNPVRAGLVACITEYPYIGSTTMPRELLIEIAQTPRPRRWTPRR